MLHYITIKPMRTQVVEEKDKTKHAYMLRLTHSVHALFFLMFICCGGDW